MGGRPPSVVTPHNFASIGNPGVEREVVGVGNVVKTWWKEAIRVPLEYHWRGLSPMRILQAIQEWFTRHFRRSASCKHEYIITSEDRGGGYLYTNA